MEGQARMAQIDGADKSVRAMEVYQATDAASIRMSTVKSEKEVMKDSGDFEMELYDLVFEDIFGPLHRRHR